MTIPGSIQPVSANELSLGELDALVLKACRGAGYSWGLSQEAGRAATWLALRGLPSADLFAVFFEQINGLTPQSLEPRVSFAPQESLSSPEFPTPPDFLTPRVHSDTQSDGVGPACPIMTGAMVSDFGGLIGQFVNVGLVYTPVIVLPFVAAVAKSTKVGRCVSIGDTRVWLNGDGEVTSPSEETLDQIFDLRDPAIVSIASVITSDDKAQGIPVTKPSRRAHVSDSKLQILDTLAHLTYVPSSDQSRGGAGAGLTDND